MGRSPEILIPKTFRTPISFVAKLPNPIVGEDAKFERGIEVDNCRHTTEGCERDINYSSGSGQWTRKKENLWGNEKDIFMHKDKKGRSKEKEKRSDITNDTEAKKEATRDLGKEQPTLSHGFKCRIQQPKSIAMHKESAPSQVIVGRGTTFLALI